MMYVRIRTTSTTPSIIFAGCRALYSAPPPYDDVSRSAEPGAAVSGTITFSGVGDSRKNEAEVFQRPAYDRAVDEEQAAEVAAAADDDTSVSSVDTEPSEWTPAATNRWARLH